MTVVEIIFIIFLVLVVLWLISNLRQGQLSAPDAQERILRAIFLRQLRTV